MNQKLMCTPQDGIHGKGHAPSSSPAATVPGPAPLAMSGDLQSQGQGQQRQGQGRDSPEAMLRRQQELRELYQRFQRHQVEFGVGGVAGVGPPPLPFSAAAVAASPLPHLSDWSSVPSSTSSLPPLTHDAIGAPGSAVGASVRAVPPACETDKPRRPCTAAGCSQIAAAARAEAAEEELRLMYASPSVAAARKEAGLPDYRPPDYGISDLPKAPSHRVG